MGMGCRWGWGQIGWGRGGDGDNLMGTGWGWKKCRGWGGDGTNFCPRVTLLPMLVRTSHGMQKGWNIDNYFKQVISNIISIQFWRAYTRLFQKKKFGKRAMHRGWNSEVWCYNQPLKISFKLVEYKWPLKPLFVLWGSCMLKCVFFMYFSLKNWYSFTFMKLIISQLFPI